MSLIITYEGTEGQARLTPILSEGQSIQDWAKDWAKGREYKITESADILPPSDYELLTDWRSTVKCSPMQGKLALGQEKWSVIETYRKTATWGEQTVIDSAQEWQRGSENIAFFGYLLNFTPEQMDDLFRDAILIKA